MNNLSHQANPYHLQEQLAGTKPGDSLTATIPNEDALDQSTIEKICNPANAKIAKDDDSIPKWTFTLHKPVGTSQSSRSSESLAFGAGI